MSHSAPAIRRPAASDGDASDRQASGAGVNGQGRRSFTQGQLFLLRFRKNTAAMVSLVVMALFLILIVFPEFIIPYKPTRQFIGYNYAPPRPIRFAGESGLQPTVYSYEQKVDLETFKKEWTEDTTRPNRIRFLVPGYEYKLLGLFPSRLHLFGLEDDAVPFFLYGSDNLGRCIFSRTIHATRISISIALMGVLITVVISIGLGGTSGYFGGVFDHIVQRISELFITIPKLPLWMVLAAAVPRDWDIIKTYLAIVVIASLTNWPAATRGIRSKLISIRNEDYIKAAISYGAKDGRLIFKYLIPNFVSYIIVVITLGIPAMILMETALSFLGIGLRPPAVSWGVLLEQAQNFQDVILHPWLLVPGIHLVIAILMFNFIGDGLRDAANPFKRV